MMLAAAAMLVWVPLSAALALLSLLLAARLWRAPNLGRYLASTATAFLLGGALAACHGADSEDCRYDPQCGGGIGGFCHDDGDCDHGFCCETGNCGGGMCTYDCSHDDDCPDGMGCQHDVCFYLCDSDDDCAHGASCEHDNTVCEWE